MIIGGAITAFFAAHLVPGLSPVTTSGLLAVGTILAMGLLGFADDYLKVNRRRSLGLNKTAKLLGQALIAVAFVALAPQTQAAREVSFVRPLGVGLGALFVVWIFVILAATANGFGGWS